MEKKMQTELEGLFNYQDIIEFCPVGTLIVEIKNNEPKIISMNNRFLQFADKVHSDALSLKYENVWTKQRLKEVLENNLFEFIGDDYVTIAKEMFAESRNTGFGQCTFELKVEHAENCVWVTSACVCKERSEDDRLYYVVFMDSTKQAKYEKQLLEKQKLLEHITQYDALTNVRNRFSYNSFIEDSKLSYKKNIGIVFANINGLKAANDTYGHEFGDAIIVDFVKIAKKYFTIDEIYRISGDEFVIIVENIGLIEFEERVKKLIIDNEKNELTSIGYKWETALLDLKQEVFNAEQLMLIQKQKYYEKYNDFESKHKPKVMNLLMAEMKDDRFVVFLQPKAEINSSRVIGAEALIRKYDDNGVIVPPYEFVPILEKELLISVIDFFVLEEVCKLFCKWREEGRRLIKISVNMSRVSVAEHNFIEHILAVCDKYQVEHKYLEFEITESAESRDNRKMIELISTLYELGFGVSLDDMGNDYSSLNMVTIYGINMIKLDRSLIMKMVDKEGIALIRHIVALCHEIGKKCIAEGVETEEQMNILAELNCDYYQGYYLNRPIPVEDFEHYLDE